MAWRDANPTDLLPLFPAEIAGQSYSPDPLRRTWQFAAMVHNALPALLAEVRELRRLTTPEPISEKHRDGNWWLVWAPGAEHWFKVRWRSAYGDWQKSGATDRLLNTPTHAVPLPGRPEPLAERGEE